MNKWIQAVNKTWGFATDRTNLFGRFFTTTNIAFDSKTNVINRKLGIPERPKKPPTGFLRYMNELRPTVIQAVKSQREVPAVVAAQWKKLDENQKQKYNQAFLNEKAVWLKQMEVYKKNLTNEQKLAIEDEKVRLKELEGKRAEKLELKTRQKELGMPNRPTSAFFLFHSEESKKSKTNVRNSKVKYDALTDVQKSIYKQKAAALFDEYKKSLQTWEKRMISKGLSDLVSKKSAPKPKT